MYNTKLAEIFEEIADMLTLDPSISRFEPLAYRKAALTIGTLQEDVGEIYKKEGVEGLMKLPGIGKGISAAIKEYIDTGKMKKYERLKKKYPVDFAGLTKIQGMGAKKALKLYKEIGVKNVADLKEAIAKHKIRGIEGFGTKSEEVLGKGIVLLESSGGRMLLGTALPEAERIRDKLLASGLVEKAIVGGSTRRMKETVGDLDMLLISSMSEKLADFIIKLQEVEDVIAKGPTKVSVRLKIGINCDFRLVERSSFGAALQYFTGNKDHNVKLREIAIKKGYKLNEYGLLDKKDRNVAASGGEEEVYGKLGLDYIEPEMREDRGEIALAQQHKLPKLVETKEIRGDLQMHTKNSDGENSIEEMAAKAIELGYEYIGITDHSKSEYVAGGMDDKKFAKYFADIDRANEKMRAKLRILKSGEVDILKDGSLDLNKKTLDSMDYRLCSIHTSLKLGKEEMTQRVVKAFESGYVDVFAHPTARLINKREPIQLDLDKVFESAEKNGVVMEVNAFPERLDLNDENILKARGYGLKFIIDTDAHRTYHMNYMRYGVGMARRGWLRKEDVINTYGIEKLLRTLKT